METKNIAEKIGNMELDDFDTEKSWCNGPELYPVRIIPGVKAA